MRKGMDTELKVGLFVTLGLALILISIIVLGGTESLLTRKNTYTTHFSNIEGLIPGAKVVIGGVQVGTVGGIGFDQKSRDVKVTLEVARAQADWIRADSAVEIQTQGVLGDKFINVLPGSPDQPAIPSGGELPNRPGQSLAQVLSRSDQLMASVQSIASSMDRLLKTFESGHRSETFFQGMATTAKNLSSATERLNQQVAAMNLAQLTRNLNGVLEKVNSGTGTLGALVNDPSLYDDMKAFVGGANRNRVVRNLVRQSIRKNEEAEAAETGAKPRK